MEPDDPRLALLQARNWYNRMVENNLQSLREDAAFRAQTGSPVKGYLTRLGADALGLVSSIPSGILTAGALAEYGARQYGRGVVGEGLLPPSAYGLGGGDLLEGGLEIGAAALGLPGVGKTIAAGGKMAAREAVTLIDVINARAAQMALSAKDRVRPRGNAFFDDSIEAAIRDTEELMPGARNPVDIEIPRPNRRSMSARGTPNRITRRVDFIDENAGDIARKMADDLRPLLGTNAQYFYHLGPVKRKLQEMGYSDEAIDGWIDEFAKTYAAFSPRTPTTQNLQNATLVMSKHAQGIDIRDILGTGTGGVSEKGYPMMIGADGAHGQLWDHLMQNGGKFNRMSNPKPATFNDNILGNHSLATVDVHATKAPLLIANDISPGSLPDEWIKPEFRQAYRDNPQSLTHNMLANGMNSGRLVDDAGNVVADRAVMEYESFSKIYDNIARELDISPAEAQALAWFNYGKRTGLKSDPGSLVDLLNERIDVTSQVMDISPEDVVRALVDRRIPLLTFMGGTMMVLGDDIIDASMMGLGDYQQNEGYY